jgi:hypothetical protein
MEHTILVAKDYPMMKRGVATGKRSIAKRRRITKGHPVIKSGGYPIRVSKEMYNEEAVALANTLNNMVRDREGVGDRFTCMIAAANRGKTVIMRKALPFDLVDSLDY